MNAATSVLAPSQSIVPATNARIAIDNGMPAGMRRIRARKPRARFRGMTSDPSNAVPAIARATLLCGAAAIAIATLRNAAKQHEKEPHRRKNREHACAEEILLGMRPHVPDQRLAEYEPGRHLTDHSRQMNPRDELPANHGGKVDSTDCEQKRGHRRRPTKPAAQTEATRTVRHTLANPPAKITTPRPSSAPPARPAGGGREASRRRSIRYGSMVFNR